MDPRLRVKVGRQANFEYEIPPSEEKEVVWVGRGAFCQVHLADSQLSRRHCEITYEDGRLFIKDLDSRNGTRVNDVLIQEPVELKGGDEITVGSHVIEVVWPSPSPKTSGLGVLGTNAAQEEADKKVRALSGQRLAGFVLEKIIFNGETSVVFQARAQETGKPAAVKVLKPLESISIEDQNRFIRGAKHSARLKHPGFVQVYKGGRADGWFFVAMEYVHGKSLQEVVEAKGGALALDTALRIIRQVLAALQYAYENDIVFRALRADNILLCEGMKVKLTDFDLVKPLTGRRDAQVTRVMDGSIQVAPEFAAPELIAYPVVADQKSDVFGAGAVLYYMLCGRAPFSKKLPADKVSSAFDRKSPKPEAINPDIPKAICEVIMRSMTDYERYNTPKEMLEALDAAVQEAAG